MVSSFPWNKKNCLFCFKASFSQNSAPEITTYLYWTHFMHLPYILIPQCDHATCIKLWDKSKWQTRSFSCRYIRINWDEITITLATFYTVVVLVQPSTIYGQSTIKHPKTASNIAKVCTWFLPIVG
jgi:hypothetical protein